MFAFVLVDLLLVNLAVASNEVHFSNGWIPVTRPFMLNQMRNSYMDTRHASGWKPSHSYDQSKKDAILIITPKQAQTIQNYYDDHELQASSEDIAAPESHNILVQHDSVHSTKLPPTEDIEKNSLTDLNHSLLKLNPKDDMQKRNVKMYIHRRAPKQVWGQSSTEELLSSDLITPDPNIKTAETKISGIVKNITNNSYEVTEPTNVQELSHQTNDLRNEYTNKFVNLLAKYNIKGHDMLNNYARSKLQQNKMLRVYPSPDSSVSFVPVRHNYNSLNHLPVDPLLAVFLSNYGYYLHGLFGLPNHYRNLYGYSASNNIHNNKPFGSYKIYSDTDSSN